MINRILIRIKVVQLLYSYLLTESRFHIESLPSQPTREKRFAYSLYVDMLVLMVLTARQTIKRGGSSPLSDNRFIAAISRDDKIKGLIAKAGASSFPFLSLATGLSEEIKQLQLYKDYARSGSVNSAGDVKVISELFKSVFMKNIPLRQAIEQRENYSARGVERMQEIMETTFSNFLRSDTPTDAIKTLKLSLNKARELYFRLLYLPVELTHLMELEIDNNRHKLLPTAEDLHPNLRFVENQLVASLRNDSKIEDYISQHKATWLPADETTLKLMLKHIKESDLYAEYMALPSTDYNTDCELWRNLFKQVILNDPDFLEALEDRSIFWNDDLEIIGTFILKTFRRYAEEAPSCEGREPNAVLDMYKDEEDATFSTKLFNAVVKNKDEYRAMIDAALHKESWDTERLAFMDVIICETAIAELLNFPKIPVTVTINEYIEMAKAYSTSKSGIFVNGLLGAVVARLRQEGRLTKE